MTQTDSNLTYINDAAIEAGGLVQVIVTQTDPIEFSLFLNQKQIQQDDIESLNVYIDASVNPINTWAKLSHYVTQVDGEKQIERKELFPCTIMITCMKHFIRIYCQNPGSSVGLFIQAGIHDNGTETTLRDLTAFTLMISSLLVQATIKATNGSQYSLLPI